MADDADAHITIKSLIDQIVSDLTQQGLLPFDDLVAATILELEKRGPIVTTVDLDRGGFRKLDEDALDWLNHRFRCAAVDWTLMSAARVYGKPHELEGSAERIERAVKTLDKEIFSRLPKSIALRTLLKDQLDELDALADSLREISRKMETVAANAPKFQGPRRNYDSELIEKVGFTIAAALQGDDLIPQFTTAPIDGAYTGTTIDLAMFVLKRIGLKTNPKKIGNCWKALRRDNYKVARKYYGEFFLP